MSLQDIIYNSLNNLQSDGDLRGAFQHIINSGVGGSSSDNGLYPPLDIIETKNNMYVYVELPGVNEESVGVDFFNNKLSISGEKIKRYSVPATKNEIVYGSFTRNITLPISVTNQGNVNVGYDKGVLTLIIDKKKEEENRFHIGIERSSQIQNVESVE